MGKVVEVAIRTTFTHHYYKWGDKVLRQIAGGPIGLRATGSVARMVMWRFLKKYRSLLEDNKVEVFLLRKYVDDILIATGCLPLGSRLTGSAITAKEEDMMEDEEGGVSKEQVTMNCLREMANSVIPWLEFTSEVSEGEQRPVPCLDSQLWVGRPEEQEPWFACQEGANMVSPGTQWRSGEGLSIMYKFYSKPVSNPLTILRRSAMAEGVKVATAVQECMRRWRNSSTGLGRTSMEMITLDYMDRLTAMGYTEEWRARILEKAAIGYARILAKVEKGESSRNRKGPETLMKRRFKRLVGSSEWFRIDEDEEPTEI